MHTAGLQSITHRRTKRCSLDMAPSSAGSSDSLFPSSANTSMCAREHIASGTVWMLLLLSRSVLSRVSSATHCGCFAGVSWAVSARCGERLLYARGETQTACCRQPKDVPV